VDLASGITIYGLAPGGAYIYVATSIGIYRIRQDTLAVELLYSVASGQGTYKVLAGENPAINGLRVFTIQQGVFLGIGKPAIGQLGGETALIRDKNNKIIRSYRYTTSPGLWQDGSSVLDMLTY
jgi:hypothetical protein